MRRLFGLVCCLGLAVSALPGVATAAPAGVLAAESIIVDGASAGRRFDGIGAVSAGASSRLLFDYPEPERGQILDYLFKPGYGASLQLLKIEIGGDTNSTDGSEPSHMRERGQVDCDLGYEWWLAKEARKRNPSITVLGLQWGAPGWLSGGFWSQDNIDYLMAWLGCADQHGLRIDYMGGWNERGYDAGWLIAFDRALAQRYPHIKLVAADDCCVANNWRIADDMAASAALRDAVDVVGVHFACGHRTEYRNCSSTPAAKGLGKPLWMSENSALSHRAGGQPIARALNLMYIDAKMTGYMAWSPVSAYYANLPIADTGLILAEWPWSGHYRVGTSVWSFAHTAQFAQPGWHYLEVGSGRLASGATHVSLRDPNGAAFSTVIEALDLAQTTTLDVQLRNLSAPSVHVWATDMRSGNSAEHFVHQGTVPVTGGRFSITLRPGFLYTVTNATGQGKGMGAPRAGAFEQMPLPYAEDFEGLAPGSLARYVSDVNGSFEAAACGAGRAGTCYRQQTTRQPIRWNGTGLMHPTTLLGDPRWWGDYEISVDLMLEQAGFAEISGRVSTHIVNEYTLGGYHLHFTSHSGWELRTTDHYAGTRVLATGPQSIGVGQWHNVRLRLDDATLTVFLDGVRVGRVVDASQRTGNIALRTSHWVKAQFDNVSVTPVGLRPRFLPQELMTATATSWHGFYRGYTHEPHHAIDGRPESMWHSRFAPRVPLPESITLDLGAAYRVQGLTVQPRYEKPSNGMITSYHVYVSADGTNFTRVASGTWPVSLSTKVVTWPARADTRFVRLEATAAVSDVVAVGELNVILGGGRYYGGSPTDFDGDNRDDIVTFTQNSAADAYVATSTGSSFAGDGVKWHDWFAPAGETPITGDFDGDGRDDAITFTQGAEADVYVALSRGSGFGPGVKWHEYFAPSGETPAVGDVDGDGRDDILTFLQGDNGSVIVSLSTGTSFAPAALWHGEFAYGGQFPAVGDFDGDGRADIAAFTKGADADVLVALSTGSSFGAAAKWHDWFSPGAEVPRIGDFDGDGRDDIVTFTHNGTADVYVALSTGSAFGPGVKWHDFFAPAGEFPYVGDFDGDGRDDIVTFTHTASADVWVALSDGTAFGPGLKWHDRFGLAGETAL